LKNPKKILIIIQRSNGDVFLGTSLINELFNYYPLSKIDLLVNEDTLAIAKLLPNINFIYTFSYQKKKESRWSQEKEILKNIYRKYDLSINLTASDRSVIYSLLASKRSISAIEKENKKSWWKKILLTHCYYFDSSKHILINNLEPLNALKINFESIHKSIKASKEVGLIIKKKLEDKKVNKFVIFHASAQYHYKIYPENLRNVLLTSLSELDLSVLITGGNSFIDLEIKKQLPSLPNVIDFIGETSIEEFISLSELSLGYIGMDTLNMHISASQNKRVFAIFGPTNLRMWSPWSNELRLSAAQDKPIQTYGNITIFQADLPCVACGNAGCDNSHGKSKCLEHISPRLVFNEVKRWYQNARL
jgi:heptosyltransferase-3